MNEIARVVGIEIGGEAVGYPYAQFRRQGDAAAVSDTVGGREVVLFWKAGTASALNDPRIARGRDVGASGVFIPKVGKRSLTFAVDRSDIVDEQTGSVWSLSGRAVSGPLAGRELKPVTHLDTFWFAWSSHNPDTAIFGE